MGQKTENGVECFSTAVRYALDGKPRESVIAMEPCDDLSALGISNVISRSLTEIIINSDKMLYQCNGGAFVMSD